MEVTPQLAVEALRAGWRRAARIILERSGTADDSVLAQACSSRDWPLAELALSLGAPLTTKVILLACWPGNLPIIRHLRALGCPWNSACFARAALVGAFDLLNYFHANGCPYSPDEVDGEARDTPIGAALRNGQLSVIKWFLEHGYPQSELDLMVTDVEDNNRTRSWMLKNGWVLTPRQVQFAVEKAARTDNLKLVRFYRSLPHCPWDRDWLNVQNPLGRGGRQTMGREFVRFLEDEMKKEEKEGGQGEGQPPQ